MGMSFWSRRFVAAFVVAFSVIAASHLLRGRGIEHALVEAALWATATAVVWCATLRWRLHRRQACAVRHDPAEGAR